MTINKFQGQTLDKVGLYLPSPVFSHSQLYVALSRIQKPSGIKIMLNHTYDPNMPQAIVYTENVVYNEKSHYTAVNAQEDVTVHKEVLSELTLVNKIGSYKQPTFKIVNILVEDITGQQASKTYYHSYSFN
ncbi:hypothetical protein PHYBLDRAFT_164102 [Phycomyces blakesleeanus NRRL 1555(-)]|uniref:Uncharacterized protein n=1 Tax=Phycomyces blakesleeanus (strain ATCC 8743b / DSM 1359 / FGSC 10004 / NBRC 33097 / NRRL 1555) TaxID=763407 RepID=A0A162UZJ9_PHYB8|nr:hypothetical protein PHYBLDRAFT_164102 [Phycomyces blakesleeanus NRRL 1555(-)]OAD79012.1 hypothetical protein PHYBLDRAFT_164102 [Phycomyces blakesleeanus NRRL 1555(-)]|eukprot:XP_018297052.1 hypothetical protein PHYBLDRAFT_164102 [Phycomyces blakesleeanus NRRL 1555(-)]